MKDFLGKELSISDLVVFIRPGYREFQTGIVIDFTPKKVRVSIDKIRKENELKGWNLEHTILQDSFQLIKIFH